MLFYRQIDDKSAALSRSALTVNIARIEVPPADIPRLAEEKIRDDVYKRFREIGFLFVTLDLKGYKLGSMNATLN